MDNNSESHRKGCPIVCLAYCFGIPLLIVGILFAILVINNRPPHIKIPPQKLPKPNGYDYFVKAGKMLPTGGKVQYGPASSTEPLDSWTMAEYEQFMRLNAPALAVFREGLSKPSMSPRSKSYYDFPSYASFREIARRLVSEAMYYEKTNQFAKAADSLLDCQELGVEVPRGGCLITGLVGFAVESIGGPQRLGPLLAKLSSNELAHVAKRLERIQAKRVPYFEIVLEEGRSSALMYAQEVRHSGVSEYLKHPWFEWPWQQSGGISKTDWTEQWDNLRYVFANKQTITIENLRFCEAVAKEQRKPYTGKSKVRVPNNLIAQMSGEMFIRAHSCQARNEAGANLLQTEVAIRRYRLDHGTYPAKLPDLIPQYLKKAPTDPFGLGKPLRYKPLKNGSQFLLYSFGLDLNNDGGTAKPWLVQIKLEDGDLVAGKW
jgi:hypothetical protein